MTEHFRAVCCGLGALVLMAAASPAAAKLMFAEDCRADAETTEVLLDVTTAYDDIDRATLAESLGDILDSLQPGQKLFIATIEDQFSHSRRLIEACIPYCPPMSLLQSIFSSCTEGMLAEKRKQLAAELHRVLAAILASSSELPHSDILRTIFYNVRERGDDDAGLTLFVFSDMLENSDLFPTRAFFALSPAELVRRAKTDNLMPKMPGATVRVFGVGRSHATDRPDLPPREMSKLVELWQAYFAAAGAAKVDLLPHLTL